MRYTVIWEPDSEADLAQIWLTADGNLRRELTKATAYFDHSLAENAHQKGTLWNDQFNERLVVAPPTPGFPIIAIACEVIPDDRLVRIVKLVVVRN